MKQILLRGALLTVLLVITGCSRSAADFTLTLGGDIILARKGEPLFNKQTAEINPWVELKDREILISERQKSPDYFFANLESPLGNNTLEPSDMNLCSDPSQVMVLLEGGLDLVSLANNHRDDCTVNGVYSTKNALEAAGIQSAAMAGAATYLDIPGGRMAVIVAEDVTGKLDVQDLLKTITKAHVDAQVVVVSIHWGNEYQGGPDERQQSLAQQMADAGADVIWGHHPHVLQKMEWLTSTDGRQVLVFYSLGNLLADQWMLEDTQQSALMRLYFKDGRIIKVEIVPIEMDRGSKTLHFASTTASRDKIIGRLGMDELNSKNVKIQLFPVIEK